MNQRNVVRVIFGGLLFCCASAAVADTGAMHATNQVLDPDLVTTLAAADPGKSLIVFVHSATIEDAVRAVGAARLKLVDRWARIGVAIAAGIPEAIRRVAADPSVSYVEPNRKVQLYLDTAHIATRAQQARDPAAGLLKPVGLPYDGSGVTIAINDVGIDGTHPMFVQDGSSKVVRNLRQTCVDVEDGCGEWIEVDNSDPYDGHGTHLAGIAAGFERVTAGPVDPSLDGRKVRGVAPGAKLVGLGHDANTTLNGYLSGLNWVLENHLDPCGDGSCPPIRVVSNSWGPLDACLDNDFKPEAAAAKLSDQLVATGIVVVFAIGNGDCTNGSATGGGDGSDNRVLYLAANPTPGVIGVANYDDAGSGDRDNALYSTSSRGLKSDPTTYPDLAAPGSAITSACRFTQERCQPTFDGLDYATLWGTSMAAPYVAGAAALLLEANPSLTPAQIEYLLEDTAHQFGAADYVADPRNPSHTTSFDRGHGLVDVAAALAAVLHRPVPPVLGSTGPRFVADGALPLAFTPDPARATGVVSPEGCEAEPGEPIGELAPPEADGPCHSGLFGLAGAVTNAAPAVFTSAPLSDPTVLGGAATFVVYIANPLRPTDVLNGGRFEYVLEEIAADGTIVPLDSGLAVEGVVDGRNQGIVELTPHTVPAGHRLRLRLTYPGYYSSETRMLFGGENYGDAGITLTVGHFEGQNPGAATRDAKAPEGSGLLVGALPSALLLPLLLAALRRGRK